MKIAGATDGADPIDELGADEASKGVGCQGDDTQGFEVFSVGGDGSGGGENTAHKGADELDLVKDTKGLHGLEVGVLLGVEVGGIKAMLDGVFVAGGGSAFSFGRDGGHGVNLLVIEYFFYDKGFEEKNNLPL